MPPDTVEHMKPKSKELEQVVDSAEDQKLSPLGDAWKSTLDFLQDQSDHMKSGFDGLKKKAGALAPKSKEPKPAKVKPEKPNPLEDAIKAYNDAFAEMSDAGMELTTARRRSTDLVRHIENLINSIANTPKSFETEIGQISQERLAFNETILKFSTAKVEMAVDSAGGAAAGAAAGAAVATLAPTGAIWVATTFGVASTGTAISTLSGAAATNAALAWLGGGALAAGGGGTAAGTALLALAGPIGWGIAGLAAASSVTILAIRDRDNKKKLKEALAGLAANTTSTLAAAAKIRSLLTQTEQIRTQLDLAYEALIPLHSSDYSELSNDHRKQLGTLVNNTLACTALLEKSIEPEATHE